MAARLSDYFLTVGVCDTLTQVCPPADDEPLAPITEIMVVFADKTKTVPAGTNVIGQTAYGTSANLNLRSSGSSPYLCFKRGWTRPYLTDLTVVFTDKELVPSGFSLLKTTFGGFVADVNKGSGGRTIHFAYKLSSTEPLDDEKYSSIPAIVDICVINASKGEQVPFGYQKIDKSLNEGSWFGAAKVYVCYKLAERRGVLDWPFATRVLDRYPAPDWPDFPLPNAAPLFCFPSGAALHRGTPRDTPLPDFSTFVLTDGCGVKVYGYCLRFYTPLPPATARRLHRLAHGADTLSSSSSGSSGSDSGGGSSDNDGSSGSGSDDGGDKPAAAAAAAAATPTSPTAMTTGSGKKKTLFQPRCLCLLSHWPFLTAFRAWLSTLYRLVSTSEGAPLPLPLERYICALLASTALPSPTRRVRYAFEMRHASDVLFTCSPTLALPVADFSFQPLFQCLSLDHVLDLLAILLCERKVLLHSQHACVLTSVAEALLALLFPLEWQCVYIPLCPEQLSGFVEAPMAFLMGMSTAFVRTLPLPEDVYTVDLDRNAILTRDPRPVSARLLPDYPTKRLKARLKVIVASAGIVGGALSARDRAELDYTPLLQLGGGARRSLSSQHVRDATLRFMVSLLRGFPSFLLNPPSRHAARTSRSPTGNQKRFNSAAFIKQSRRGYSSFLTSFVDSQMFVRMVESHPRQPLIPQALAQPSDAPATPATATAAAAAAVPAAAAASGAVAQPSESQATAAAAAAAATEVVSPSNADAAAVAADAASPPLLLTPADSGSGGGSGAPIAMRGSAHMRSQSVDVVSSRPHLHIPLRNRAADAAASAATTDGSSNGSSGGGGGGDGGAARKSRGYAMTLDSLPDDVQRIDWAELAAEDCSTQRRLLFFDRCLAVAAAASSGVDGDGPQDKLLLDAVAAAHPTQPPFHAWVRCNSCEVFVTLPLGRRLFFCHCGQQFYLPPPPATAAATAAAAQGLTPSSPSSAAAAAAASPANATAGAAAASDGTPPSSLPQLLWQRGHGGVGGGVGGSGGASVGGAMPGSPLRPPTIHENDDEEEEDNEEDGGLHATSHELRIAPAPGGSGAAWQPGGSPERGRAGGRAARHWYLSWPTLNPELFDAVGAEAEEQAKAAAAAAAAAGGGSGSGADPGVAAASPMNHPLSRARSRSRSRAAGRSRSRSRSRSRAAGRSRSRGPGSGRRGAGRSRSRSRGRHSQRGQARQDRAEGGSKGGGGGRRESGTPSEQKSAPALAPATAVTAAAATSTAAATAAAASTDTAAAVTAMPAADDGSEDSAGVGAAGGGGDSGGRRSRASSTSSADGASSGGGGGGCSGSDDFSSASTDSRSRSPSYSRRRRRRRRRHSRRGSRVHGPRPAQLQHASSLPLPLLPANGSGRPRLQRRASAAAAFGRPVTFGGGGGGGGSNATAVTRQGVRLPNERRKGDPSDAPEWATFLRLQFYGAWFLCIPSLLLLSPARSERLLLRAFGVLSRLRAWGLPADQPMYRALLVACGRCGPAHSRDAVRLLRDMGESGMKPAPTTYNLFASALATRADAAAALNVVPQPLPPPPPSPDTHPHSTSADLERAGRQWQRSNSSLVYRADVLTSTAPPPSPRHPAGRKGGAGGFSRSHSIAVPQPRRRRATIMMPLHATAGDSSGAAAAAASASGFSPGGAVSLSLSPKRRQSNASPAAAAAAAGNSRSAGRPRRRRSRRHSHHGSSSSQRRHSSGSSSRSGSLTSVVGAGGERRDSAPTVPTPAQHAASDGGSGGGGGGGGGSGGDDEASAADVSDGSALTTAAVAVTATDSNTDMTTTAATAATAAPASVEEGPASDAAAATVTPAAAAAAPTAATTAAATAVTPTVVTTTAADDTVAVATAAAAAATAAAAGGSPQSGRRSLISRWFRRSPRSRFKSVAQKASEAAPPPAPAAAAAVPAPPPVQEQPSEPPAQAQAQPQKQAESEPASGDLAPPPVTHASDAEAAPAAPTVPAVEFDDDACAVAAADVTAVAAEDSPAVRAEKEFLSVVGRGPSAVQLVMWISCECSQGHALTASKVMSLWSACEQYEAVSCPQCASLAYPRLCFRVSSSARRAQSGEKVEEKGGEEPCRPTRIVDAVEADDGTATAAAATETDLSEGDTSAAADATAEVTADATDAAEAKAKEGEEDESGATAEAGAEPMSPASASTSTSVGADTVTDPSAEAGLSPAAASGSLSDAAVGAGPHASLPPSPQATSAEGVKQGDLSAPDADVAAATAAVSGGESVTDKEGGAGDGGNSSAAPASPASPGCSDGGAVDTTATAAAPRTLSPPPEACRGASPSSHVAFACAWGGAVPLFTPPVLRARLERAVLLFGDAALDHDDLRRWSPPVFWNLVWFCAVFSVPLPLPFPRALLPESYLDHSSSSSSSALSSDSAGDDSDTCTSAATATATATAVSAAAAVAGLDLRHAAALDRAVATLVRAGVRRVDASSLPPSSAALLPLLVESGSKAAVGPQPPHPKQAAGGALPQRNLQAAFASADKEGPAPVSSAPATTTTTQ